MNGHRGGEKSLVEQIDKLLEVPKELAGDPSWADGMGAPEVTESPAWQPSNHDETRRLVWPVLVNGRLSHCNVTCTAYPHWRELRFTITLNWQNKNIWRLDWENDRRCEQNPESLTNSLSGLEVCGPHCHRWESNRQEVKSQSIPSSLPFREPLPERVKSGTADKAWERCFRWFLDQVNIEQPRIVPELPKRERLL